MDKINRQEQHTAPIPIPYHPYRESNDSSTFTRFTNSIHRANTFKFIEHDPNRTRTYIQNDNDVCFNPKTMGLQRGEGSVKLSSVLNSVLVKRTADDSTENSVCSVSYGSIPNQWSSSSTATTEEPVASHIQIQNIAHEGKSIPIIKGHSTPLETVFNSVNVLIGIGILALPLALHHSGWVIGIPTLTLAAFLTWKSSRWLSDAMARDLSIMTYSDLAYVTFGPRGRCIVSILVSLDLLANGVCLIVLFADSLHCLIPEISVIQFKFLALILLTPSSFIPLNILSFVSLGGIICTTSVVLTVFAAGLIKSTTPGSLIQFAPTNLYPASYGDLLISIGMLMAPFGGHSVFPNLKTDMRCPSQFKSCLSITYTITYLSDMSMAVIGFLMFGFNVQDEVTKSILLTQGYPDWVYYAVSALIAFVPFSKVALNAKPIISILDFLTGCDLHDDEDDDNTRESYLAGKWKKTLRFNNKILVNLSFVVIAIMFPEFEKIIAFLGAGLCFVLCLILPACFYLYLSGDHLGKWEKFELYVIISVSALLAILGVTAAVIY